MQRPIWRGHLRLALVSCPVALYSAHHAGGTLHFHLINPGTGNRIRMITQDAETGDELSRSDLVKGYEYQKGEYLVLTEEEFDSVRVDSSDTIKIDKFLDAAAIDPLWFDAAYFMAPDGTSGIDVYKVLREAVAKTGRVALSRVVIARRERAIAIRAYGLGFVVHTLHESRDLNDPAELFEPLEKQSADREMVALAVQLIQRQHGAYDPADFEDRYETRLRALIAAKAKGKPLKEAAAAATADDNVIDLMAALKRSLAGGTAEKPAKKAAAKSASAGKPVPTGKRAAKRA
jgi:DNA end-binding protein Ku